MQLTGIRKTTTVLGAGVALATVVAVGGCAQSGPMVGEAPRPDPWTPIAAEQAATLVYSCSYGHGLQVTRIEGNTLALVTIDGRYMRFYRDTTFRTGERYTDRARLAVVLSGMEAKLEMPGIDPNNTCTLLPSPPGTRSPPLPTGGRERDDG
jgi:hypothetical protein